MFRLTKAILNNVNDKPFENNMTETSLVKDFKNKNLSKEEVASLKKIYNLEMEARTDNLLIFAKHFSYVLLNRFFLVTLPAIISVATIKTAALPNKEVEPRMIEKHTGVHSLYNPDEGVREFSRTYLEQYQVRYYDVDEEVKILPHDIDKQIMIQIFDDEENSFSAKFVVYSSGNFQYKLPTRYDDIYTEKYDKCEITDSGNNFDELYNKIMKLIDEDNIISKKSRATLNKLTETEKRTILMEVIDYNSFIEEIEGAKTKSNIPKKVYYFALTSLYIALAYRYLKEKEFKEKRIYNDNGELKYEDEMKRFSLLYGPLKVRNAFIQAEADRIEQIKEEITFNITLGNCTEEDYAILTDYEKELKYKKRK